RARIAAAYVHLQNGGRKIRFPSDVGWRLGDVEGLSPILPAGDESVADRLVSFTQARTRLGASASDRRRKPQGERAFVGAELADESNIAIEGFAVGPGHPSVSGKVLPSIGCSDIPGARPREADVSRQAERAVILPGHQVRVGPPVVCLAGIV